MVIRSIVVLIELFAYLYCLASLFGQKFKLSIYAVILIILDLLLWTGLNDYGLPEFLMPLDYISMFVYGLLYYKESVRRTLVNYFLAVMIVTVLQLFVFFPSFRLFFIKYEQGEIHELIINSGCLILVILLSHWIKFKRLSDFFVKRNKLIAGVFIMVFCGLGITIYQMATEGAILTEVYIQMVYFILLFIFTIYEWQKTRLDVEKKKAQLEMNRLYYEAYDRLILLVRERQHDMKNHINAILSMIYTTDSYEELTTKQKEYCDYVIGQHEETKLVLSAGNPLVAGFLYSKIQEAEKKGIEVDYHIEMQKAATVVPEYELVEIIGILIDNALEALCKDSAVENPKIENRSKKLRLTIDETENKLELTVANTSDYYEEDMTEHFFESGYSSKGMGRGIGLSKLKRMVQDRQGDIVVSNELLEGENYLTFMIRIYKEKRQKF